MLKTMLQRAVNNIPTLRQVKNDDHQRVVRGLAPLRYDEYYILLRSAAQTADEVRKTRQVNQTIVDVNLSSIDDDTSPLEIHKVDQALRLPDHVYNQFDLEDRKQWSGFSDDARRKLVSALHPKRSDTNPRSSGASSRPRPKRSVNTTTVSSEDSNDNSSVDHGPDSTSSDNLEVNQVQTNNGTVPTAHPGDVHRSLATSNPPKSTTNKDVC